MNMAATTFLPATPKLPHRGISRNPRRNGLIIIKRVVINANQGGESEGKDHVDENMIVLRMRIKKMKVLESTSSNHLGAAPPSSDWKEWERKLFTHYHEGVCDSVALLQSYLMNTRPSVALGILALVAMSVPFSTSVVMVNVLKVAKELLAGSHMCIDIDF